MSKPAVERIKSTIRERPGVPFFKVDPTLQRLQWNESPFDFPPALKEQVLERLASISWSRYPLGFRAVDVINAVAGYYGLPNDQVVVGNGSSDLLRVILSAVLGPGDHMITLAPTFGMYRSVADMLGATVSNIELDPAQSFALPVHRIIEAAQSLKAKMIVICAPNNPTGTAYSIDEIQEIVRNTESLVVVDEAYAEFSDQDFLPLLAESDRVILVHTLSKAFASAGARIGYLLADSTIASELQKVVNTFTLSPFSEAVALVALENSAVFEPFIAQIVAERERLTASLSRLPNVKVFPSATNFVLVYLGQPAKAIHAFLVENQNVLTTDMAMYPGYSDYLRITIGSPEQNNQLLQGMNDFFARNAA